MLPSLALTALVLSSSVSATDVLSLWKSISPAAVAAVSLLTKPVPNTGANPSLTKNRVFTVPHTDGQDDSPALIAALSNYTTNATILFKEGVAYNIWTPLVFTGLNNVEIVFGGNLSLPTDVATIQNIVAKSTFSGHWFKISGTSVTLRGSLSPKSGWIDSHGVQWWNANNTVNRPHLLNFATTNSTLHNLKVKDSIGWNFALSSGKNIHAYGNLIDIQQRPGGGFPFNTDGFAAGGTNLIIENNVIINGDDCVTVGSGAKNVVFRNTYCEGGHGLSIGSLGKGGSVASVHDVLIENVAMVNELYGARFKSWTGGNGIAQNVTWRNIYVQNVPFPIYVTQNYWDQNLGPKPNTTSTNNTVIDDMHFQNFYGTLDDDPYLEGTCTGTPCWYEVPGATGKEVVIFDLYPGTATNITATNIKVKPDSGAKAAVMCDPTTVTSNTGFKCWDGAYIAS